MVTLPREKVPATGQWMTRSKLVPQMIRIGRFDLRYVRAGQGPTLILVHGLASSIYTWSEVIAPLAKSFDVIAFDLPGFGSSSQPDDLSFDEYGGTVVGLMETLGVQRAHFVGNSMGGAIALLMAARQGDRVDRVVVLDSAGFAMRPSERPFIIQLLASKGAAFLVEGFPLRRRLTAASLRYLVRDDAKVTQERIDEYVAPFLREGALASTRSLLLSRLDERFIDDLRGITAPTLVVWGRFDPWLPESHADRFVAAIKGSRKVVLDTGHMPQEEQPEGVARLLGEFLLS